jgi:Fe-S oxidoreductase
MVKKKEMILPKDPRYLRYPIDEPFDPRWTAWNCSRCSCCKWIDSWRVKSAKYARICPQHKRYLYDAYSAQGKCDLALAVIDGKMKWGDDPAIKDILFRCTLCGGCDTMDKCIRDGEVLKLQKWMRAEYIKAMGVLPDHQPLMDSVRNYDNVWIQPRARRNSWAKDMEIKDLNTDKAEVLLFVGCTYGLSEELKGTIRNVAAILKKARVNFGILGSKELCCGSPVEKIGVLSEFERLATSNIERFNKIGVKTVVAPCAGCYGTIREEYDRFKVKQNFEVLHITELFDQLIEEGKLTFKKEVPLKVTWHDPCHQGRLSRPYVPGREIDGVYEQPRNILQAIPGIELYEMERIKEYAWCCGGGGGVFTAFKDFAQWTALERLEEAKDTGAQVLATSCPWCESNLGNAVKGMEEKIGIASLTDLMVKAL